MNQGLPWWSSGPVCCPSWVGGHGWIQSLVGELRSRMLHVVAKKKKGVNEPTKKANQHCWNFLLDLVQQIFLA